MFYTRFQSAGRSSCRPGVIPYWTGLFHRSFFALALAAPGCQFAPAPAARPSDAAAPAPPAQLLARTELFFGLSRPDGGQVSEAQWREFLADTVTPRFPDGLTVLEGYGQWRQHDGVIAREPCRIVLFLHEPTPDADRRIEQIRAAYKERFAQEAVMRTDVAQRVSF